MTILTAPAPGNGGRQDFPSLARCGTDNPINFCLSSLPGYITFPLGLHHPEVVPYVPVLQARLSSQPERQTVRDAGEAQRLIGMLCWKYQRAAREPPNAVDAYDTLYECALHNTATLRDSSRSPSSIYLLSQGESSPNRAVR